MVTAFGPFVVVAPAGRGGTADVYRAEDSRTHRLVALKVAGPRDGANDALRREAEALRALSHPGIVGYVGEGTTEHGTAYVATEWVDGESLATRLARGALSTDDALAMARALATTLRFIHESGFVHRDLKPGNVMLEDADVRRPKLVDFGFACRLQEPSALALSDALLRVREVMGTPAYMAPEQARGDAAPDTRADVYSFGALLYRCLTGQAPFSGRDALATLTRVLFDDPTPLRELAPRVPQVVATLVARTMRKEPARRPRDGAALTEALRELDGEPGPASIAPMPIARSIVCAALCRLPPVTGADALQAWGRNIRVVRDVVTAEGAEFRLLGEGNVASFFDGDETESAAAIAQRAVRSASAIASAIPGAVVGVTCGYGTTNTSAPELVENARALIEGAAPGVLVDGVVDALLPPDRPRQRTPTGRRRVE